MAPATGVMAISPALQFPAEQAPIKIPTLATPGISSFMLHSGGVIDGCHSEEARPTAVTISNFTAQAQVSVPSVSLQWDTDNEVTLLGFNIYRAATVMGLRQKLNINLIPAQHPGQMVSGQYSYEDQDVIQGDTYYYWIEAVMLGDMTEEIGPRSAALVSRIYLPMVLR